jgi:CBS domain-containing protein
MSVGKCGTFPGVHEGKTVGMITDRDICLALAEAQCNPSELPVADVMSEALYGCHSEDEIEEAIDAMTCHQVRRLPVLDRDRTLIGVLSIDDILASAGESGNGPSYRAAVVAFQAICRRAGPIGRVVP